MVQFTVVRKSRKGDDTENQYELRKDMTVREFRNLIQEDFGVHRTRQGLKLELDGGKVERFEDMNKKVAALGVEKGSVVVLKDLGPQFSYIGVFLLEYFGPMVIVPLLLVPQIRHFAYYGHSNASQVPEDLVQVCAGAWGLHYLKRELETLFVHKFSRETMPLTNLFKNCGYYWSFAALVGYTMCHPDFQLPEESIVYAGLAAMGLFELINLYVHLWFSWQRKDHGDQTRKPPTGGVFTLVSCPNYTAEVFSWVAFSIATANPMCWLFTFVGFAQMAIWALKKHKGYVKQDPALKKRAAIIPFIL